MIKMTMILENSAKLTRDLIDIYDELDRNNDLKKIVYAEIMGLRQKIRDDVKSKLGIDVNEE